MRSEILALRSLAVASSQRLQDLADRFDAGRNLTVEVLEYFDALRLTRREGNTRSLLGRANVQQILGVGP